jgi:hypothetical protein
LLIHRTKFIRRAEQVLRHADQPRFQMSVIVLATGAVGFLASYLFLHFGLTSMAVRYPLAIGVAYLTFLGLLRIWLAYQERRLDDGPDFLNVIDPIPVSSTGTSMAPSGEAFTGGGGKFGGGGASASFDDLTPSEAFQPSSNVIGGDGISNAADAVSVDLDALWLAVAALLVLVGGALIVFYVIYIAPALFAEILVDGVLVAGLYRRLHKEQAQHWLATAVKQTWLPVAGMAAIFAIGGFLMQNLAPQARSIGDLLR